MLALIGIIAFVAILYLGSRYMKRALAASVSLDEAMRRAGFALSGGAEPAYVAERDGQFLTVRVMERGLVTLSCATSANVEAHSIVQRYTFEGSHLQPDERSDDAVSAAVDAVVLGNAKSFGDTVGLGVGPGIVSVLVFGLTEPVLARQVLRVAPAAQHLLTKVTQIYEAHGVTPRAR